MIDGSVRVRRNIVWGKGIRAFIMSSDYTLVGEAGSGSPMTISSLHPEYGVDSWSGCCIDAQVIFTPYTDPADVSRLMDVDLSCLTRRTPCKTKAEILPTAWNESVAEEKSKKYSAPRTCTADVIRVLSRESERVVVGSVTKMGGASDWVCGPSQHCVKVPTAGYGEVTVLLQGDFKPWNPWFPLAPEDRTFSHPLPMKEKIGDRYVFFFQHPIVEYRVDLDDVCARLPATAENIAAVRRGVAEDWADHNYDFRSSPGLGDLRPPDIDVH